MIKENNSQKEIYMVTNRLSDKTLCFIFFEHMYKISPTVSYTLNFFKHDKYTDKISH